ncbi:MAG TPA: efflux RND transporter periplasmic adaptor subunit [Candidatus Saccharimonadales bacterium]|jgi:RND family efflux transporter MFP subunit|nr:efflux RND transporter periplasmic adaptor subunit [Candidatus Saccharimonadales bacterium]
MTSNEKNAMTVPEPEIIGAETMVPRRDGIERRQGSRRGTPVLLSAAAFAALALVIYSGIHARAAAESRLKQRTEDAAIPSVSVVFPQLGAPTQEIVLPGNTQAFSDAPIYARTSGYLSRWHFDIGAHVQKGQLLAEIETPEIDQQLQQAQAELDTAQANLKIAKITAARWQDLVSTGSVSQQETDQAVSNLSAVKATAESSAANMRRLEQLQSFEKIYAPFDGIITARNTDIGALIDAGANAQPRELFHITAIRTLRVYVSVPEVYSRAARPGATATLTLDEFPGQTFHGTLVRNANSIDIASRTLLVEVDVDNPTGQLLPGAYVFVHLKLPDQTRSVTIPSNTLIFRKEGLQVGLVRNGKAELVPVKIGRDYGNAVEIVSGLQATDAVIVDPSDSLVAGLPVRQSNKATGGAVR